MKEGVYLCMYRNVRMCGLLGIREAREEFQLSQVQYCEGCDVFDPETYHHHRQPLKSHGRSKSKPQVYIHPVFLAQPVLCCGRLSGTSLIYGMQSRDI